MYHSSTCYSIFKLYTCIIHLHAIGIVFNMNNEKGYFAFSYFIEYYFTTHHVSFIYME